MKRLWGTGFVGVMLLVLLGYGGAAMTQASNDATAQVEARLRQYDALVHALDAKGIAAMFNSDGEIQHESQPATQGREGIESLYASFSGYSILENSTTPTGTLTYNNLAVQVGAYHQKVKTPDGSLLEVSGSFQADWVKSKSGEWLIKRLGTTSP